MSDFVTLSCPSCGGKLKITSDIDRFACTYCGQEHIVNRGEGVIYLSPITDSVQKIETNTDKTASELAIVRLQKEISYWENKRAVFLQLPPIEINMYHPDRANDEKEKRKQEILSIDAELALIYSQLAKHREIVSKI